MRLRTPANDREWIAVPDFSNVPKLIEQNRSLLDSSTARIGGIPFSEFRRQTREELLGDSINSPIVVTGHQPELHHPGVWVKNFAACGLAQRIGGASINLIVDSDAAKSAAIALPTWREWTPGQIKLEQISFAENPREQSWESWQVRDEILFSSVPKQLEELAQNWGYEPIAGSSWNRMTGATYADRFTSVRLEHEKEWGCSNIEIRTSDLSQTRTFRLFAEYLIRDRDRFREVHNSAVREYRRVHHLRSKTHPVPELAEGESPFWLLGSQGRERVFDTWDPARLRPRALTLTLFVRLFLADWFIHGIGGGKYDAVTDRIIQNYFGIEPPQFQVISATLLLPLPTFPSTPDDLKRLQRLARDLRWNPQRYGTSAASDHEKLVNAPVEDARQRYRAFRALLDRQRPEVRERIEHTEQEIEHTKHKLAANAILRRRDLPWVLYPGPFLKSFLVEMKNRAAEMN